MLISNITDLNRFVTSHGEMPKELIVEKLAESKVIVSAKIAKLILRKIKPSKTPYATKAQM